MSSKQVVVEAESVARHEIENVLHTHLYPGSEIMADIGDVHFKQAGHHVLVPQPSNDPRDPLNWSPMWKGLSMSAMAVSSFTMILGPLAPASQVPYYIAEFGRPLPDIIQFIGVTILVLGFSNIIWVPFSRAFGRRPMLLVTTLITIASSVWRAKAQTYGSFMGACILSGIGTGPAETLGPILVTDVMFLHERGLYMGIYSWAVWSGVFLGPVIAGVTAEKYGWRSFWWICTALSCFSLIYQLIFLPETKWHRAETQVSVGQTIPEVALADEGMVFGSEGSNTNQEVVVKLSGSPSKGQFSILAKFDKEEPILRSILLPFRLFAFPIVQWSALVFAWGASCFLVANVTQSQALAGPPWVMSASAVGYTNFAIFAGACFALFTVGPLSDWVSMRSTKKNRGIREAEMRLPLLIPIACTTLVGSLVIAIGYQHGWSWQIIVIIGYTLLGFQCSAIAIVSTTYAIDSYKPVSGEYLVSATVYKNLWAYGLTKFINVWIEDIGYIAPIMTNAGLCVFFTALGIPMYFYGKRLRGLSKDSSVHKAE